ncbi:MAG: Rrf2 family transcriptional regulator [Flavobacteriaceae bacterium]|nr:Rrf2 family transcriptional regulator [Flavobacteriaceae bacterium]
MISHKTKYGFKALCNLARRESNDPVQISVIAEEENISLKFLESILLTLKKAGFLGAKKGKGGGYYLLDDTRSTPVASFYRVLEGPIAMVPCVSLNFYEKCEDCPDENLCSVHSLMIQVRDNTLSILENTTLNDFVKNQFI